MIGIGIPGRSLNKMYSMNKPEVCNEIRPLFFKVQFVIVFTYIDN